MKIVIAPNSFKGSLDAFEVARAIERGLLNSQLNVTCDLFPIADGGDHTLEVFHNWIGGDMNIKKVTGPLGDEVEAAWLHIKKNKTAVIEMARSSGISLVRDGRLNPLKANSIGTGELILDAVNNGAQKIILGLGGSATVDGGLGILQSFGADLYDSSGEKIPISTNPLIGLDHISIENIDQRLKQIEFQILCDVENPLLGQNGAAHIFGPQKGANSQGVEILEKSMKRFNEILAQKTGLDFSQLPGAGAAGGIAVALMSFFNTSIVSGVDFILEKMNFEESVKDASYLITAEGKVDSQTLHGKGPLGVADKAKMHNIPTIILAGKADEIDQLNHGFDAVFAITNGPMSLDNAMNRTAIDLEETARQIGNLLATK